MDAWTAALAQEMMQDADVSLQETWHT